ncbi:MAG: hypothetical protein KDB88_02215 [Flavobacteriales bacterium]|nr:hypothetical protein [Flavobacteriales bacterium]
MNERSALVIAFWVFLGNGLVAQLAPGFVPEEARDMAALCTVHTFQDLYGSDEAMVPAGYVRTYSSMPTALDNKFEVFRKGATAVLEIRGSTANMMSWMVNVYSAMIPASGTIQVNGKDFRYHFADDTSAAVHSGYVLGLCTMLDEVVEQLYELDADGIEDVIITGHSQGGALAHLMRAYLEHAPKGTVPKKMNFKTYSFAGPMVGDKAFAKEYEKKFCTRLTSYSIINPKDPFPGMPVSYEEGNAFSMGNMMSLLFGGDVKAKAMGSLMNLFSGSLVGIAQSTGRSVEKRIEGALGEVIMPPFRPEVNYHPMAERIELEPFDYPLILKDSTILQNDSIMRVEQRDADGVFLNKDLYKKAPGTFHHKPYNYYVAILKRWFPLAYEELEVKILPENL